MQKAITFPALAPKQSDYSYLEKQRSYLQKSNQRKGQTPLSKSEETGEFYWWVWNSDLIKQTIFE